MDLLWIFGLLKVPQAFLTIVYVTLYFWCDYFVSFVTRQPVLNDTYDFIVVGAGSAGAVVASRLSESGKYSVLLLEAGGHPAPLVSHIPLVGTVMPATPLNWNFQTEPQPSACAGLEEQRSRWPRGKGLGGSSILNYMLYVRGNKQDYDNWEQLGNTGWSYEDVLPYFIKSEDNKGLYVNSEYHGTEGPLTVEDRSWASGLPRAFVEAGYELGYEQVDVNGANQTGFAFPQVTMRHGERWSTYKAFLEPIMDRTNLKMVTHAHVHKVLIDEHKHAYGIRYERHGHVETALAEKEIVLSAGAIGSPQILMLSGLGPKQHLEDLGIDVIADMKVGENLQDHPFVGVAPLVHNDSTAALVKARDLKAWWEYFVQGNGPYTSNGIDGMAFTTTKYSPEPEWPDIQLHFSSFSPATDLGTCMKDILGLHAKTWKYYEEALHKDTASILVTLVRPKSRGWVRLNSTDPLDYPLINPRYYSNPKDLDTMLEGIRFARLVASTSAMRQHGMSLLEAPYPFCKHHDMETEEYWRCYAQHTTMTLYHPAGTCKMGPASDKDAVVDPQLRVHGIERLRVIDASIMPIIVNGNTNAPVIMIGEKGSDLILQHWDNLTPNVEHQVEQCCSTSASICKPNHTWHTEL